MRRLSGPVSGVQDSLSGQALSAGGRTRAALPCVHACERWRGCRLGSVLTASGGGDQPILELSSLRNGGFRTEARATAGVLGRGMYAASVPKTRSIGDLLLASVLPGTLAKKPVDYVDQTAPFMR